MRLGTPLWPAGHLPRKGGDQLIFPVSPVANTARFAAAKELPISALAGEMAGRAEGGA
ncbi:lytic murein transglycosylase [Mesorhizobium sp. WSM3866]|nr:lytic murein transglycosylase [Mesorhizobium sp. WSM3866]RUW02532.1 lytic murein transglycosylase [Mesorhizobium sp. M1A.F.Ca.IN.020.04.1.1]RUW16405.1 lytic murein transglycosylase [Mesorhizobium sp. M1A.F.Ca.IN.020.03.1.1]RWG17735.1 MAG: lytic murein transglycosylase [Mesorhizobium sp.]RWG31874.1 MAG: lytic murein transglycosylase [Mesorhizobium sp.]